MATHVGRLVCSGSILALCAATPVLGQGAADVPSTDLDAIIVRGELQERDIQDTPTSVTVFTGESIERTGDVDIYDLFEGTPNVTAANGRQGFTIRGIDQRGVGGGGSGQVISTQIDGVALPGNQSTFFGPYSTWDIQQVEILRGPQSTQQGRNALAGAIIIRTNDPTYEQEFKFRGEAGSRSTVGGAMALNTPLIEDTLAFRFAADTFRTDGWVENPTRGENDYDRQSLQNYRAKLRWDPTDDIETILSYSRTKNEGGEDFFDEAFWPENRFNLSDVDAEEGSDHQIWGLRVNWDINDVLRLESETSYYTSDYFRQEDLDFTAEELGLFRRDGDSRAFEQDLRLRFSTARFNGVFGLFYSDTHVENPSIRAGDARAILSAVPAGLVSFEQLQTFGNDSENFAVFGEVDIDASQLTEGLSFTLGMRYDRETVKSFTSLNTTTDPPRDVLQPLIEALFPDIDLDSVIPESGPRESERTFDAWLPKFAVSYDWTPDIMTAFTVQRGYRAGGSQINNFTLQINEFDPEFVWNYEVAFRGQFLDDRLTTNFNAFYLDWQDQQVNVRGPSGNVSDINVINAGNSRVWGGEFFLDAEVTPQFDVFAGVGFARTEFLDFVDGDNDFSGNRFPGAPEWTGSIGGQYRFANGVIVEADAAYVGSSFSGTDNDPRSKSDDRFLVNAQVSYEIDELVGTLFVRNLFDVDYATDRGFDETTASSRIRAGEPLTIGAILQYTF